MPDEIVRLLPHLNAGLNFTAAVLLVFGYRFIRNGREAAHRNTMLASFVVSTIFLCSYLVYHQQAGHIQFPDYPPMVIRSIYLTILATHIVLAIPVPFLAVATIFLAFRNWRSAHRKLAKIVFPIWLYVSVTGVIVYLMLYQIFPPRAGIE